MNKKTDVIVIGGGHNGLTTACLLAKAGKQVTLVEKRESLGGLAAAIEFETGFRSAGLWHDVGNVSRTTMKALELEQFVTDEVPPVHALGEGVLATITGPADRAAFELAQHIAADGRNYARYRKFMGRIRPVMERFLTHRPLNVLAIEDEAPLEVLKSAFGLRMLGGEDMIELLRVAPMPVVDFLDEYFESDFIKGALSMSAVLGTFTAPRSPGTTLHLLFQEALAGKYFKGGATALTAELGQRAADLGVEILTGATVKSILLSKKQVRGVELVDGTQILADSVSASCNPKTVLLDLLPVGALSYTTERRVSNFRCRGTAAQMLFAVDGPVTFSDGTAEHELQRVRIAPTANHVESAFDAIKYNEISQQPVLDIAVPTLEQPSLAPAGKSVVSVLVGYVPYELDGGWNDTVRGHLTEKVIATIGRHVRDFDKRLIATKVFTPADIETEYGLPGGSLYHGEPGIDQLIVRPVPECFDHRTPIAGLSLCGSGTHPGGSVSCMAGSLATRAVLHPRKPVTDAAA